MKPEPLILGGHILQEAAAAEDIKHLTRGRLLEGDGFTGGAGIDARSLDELHEAEIGLRIRRDVQDNRAAAAQSRQELLLDGDDRTDRQLAGQRE